MKLSDELIKKRFVIAGIMNITGSLIFSRFLTNETIPEIDPDVMSNP